MSVLECVSTLIMSSLQMIRAPRVIIGSWHALFPRVFFKKEHTNFSDGAYMPQTCSKRVRLGRLHLAFVLAEVENRPCSIGMVAHKNRLPWCCLTILEESTRNVG